MSAGYRPTPPTGEELARHDGHIWAALLTDEGLTAEDLISDDIRAAITRIAEWVEYDDDNCDLDLAEYWRGFGQGVTSWLVWKGIVPRGAVAEWLVWECILPRYASPDGAAGAES